MLDALSPNRRRFLLLLTAAVVVALAVGAGLAVLRERADQVTPVAQDRPGPVLLVSGYGGSTGSLEPVRRSLEAAGRDVVVVASVGSGTGDLAAEAVALGRAARSAMRRYAAGSVDVVGYSAGGVVARLWVRSHGGASVARRVLSIGSPHHGTAVAELAAGTNGCPTACRQLAPDSPLLRRLNAGDETPPGPVFVSVWSTTDRTVVPASSARLAGALGFTVQSVCPGDRASHGGLPSDPVVAAALGSTLGRGAPSSPSPATCT
jgi:triacylglycerol lipase